MLVTGLPCQPYSQAGKRIGNTDHRSFGADGQSGPIPQTVRIISECRPAVVFFENVPAWVRGGWFRDFGDALSGMGYAIVDPVFIAASDVGASHERERVFILAVATEQRERWKRLSESAGRFKEADADWRSADMAHTEGGPGLVGRSSVLGATSEAGGSPVRECRSAKEPGISDRRFGQKSLEDPSRNVGSGRQRPCSGTGRGVCEAGSQLANPGNGLIQEPGRGPKGRTGNRSAGEVMADTALPTGAREQQRRNELFSTSSAQAFAPGPSDPIWQTIIAETPWLAPAVESGICHLVDGHPVYVDASRADKLRCLGNAVVPLCASVALVELLRGAGLKE
jgi:DNA (cytosine-5)-methyltransferase 1